MQKLDDTGAVEVAEGIWWVGFADYEAGFSNNPYLLVDGDEAVLFDPGPGHPLFRDIILQKIAEITEPERIRYLVVHHQDPDLCGLIPFIERQLHPDIVLIAHPRTSLFVPYYGARTGILPVGDGDVLELRSGRRITFIHAPYLHFAGNMLSYDEQTHSLFSSDIFAVFDRDWRLFADESYLPLARQFLENYIGSREPLDYVYERLRALSIKRILPQHGGIIMEEHVSKFLEMLRDVEPGVLLEDLCRKPTPEQMAVLLATGKEWLEFWLKRPVEADAFDDLMRLAIQQGPTTVSLLIDSISAKAREFQVSNPLTHSQVHRWDSVWSTETAHLIDGVRRRFLSRQYGMRYGQTGNVASTMEQGLSAFKTEVGLMFVDIRGFTRWSADKPASVVVGALDRQLELMARVISAAGGRVNKVLGDGLLVYFPGEKVQGCLAAAFKLQQAVADHELLSIGVGCDFGEVIMGDIGQERRLDYSLIGSAVNYASRMCDRAGPGDIVIGEGLQHRLGDSDFTHAKSYSSESIRVRIKPTDPERGALLLRRASRSTN